MSDGVAQDQIRAFVDRILRLKEEAASIKGDIREVYAEAKANGFDKTVLGKLVNYVEKRAKSADTLAEQDALFDLYLSAYDGVPSRDFDEEDERPSRTHAHAREADHHSDLRNMIPSHDPITGEIADEHPMSHASGQPGGKDPETTDDAASAGEDGELIHEPQAEPATRGETAANAVRDGQGHHPSVLAEGGNDVAAPPAHAPEQPGNDHGSVTVPAEGSAHSAAIRRMSMTPLEPREAGGLKGFGFTVRFDEPEAAMLPQTAGSKTAVANSTPGSGAGTVDAGGANWPSEMTTASPANEPETIPPVADPATVVSEAGGGDSAPSLAAIPVADHSKPNPICRDPGECGVYASWEMPCQACVKAAAAHRVAA